MEKVLCASCKQTKARVTCGLCETPICRTCAQFLERHSFLLWEPKVPAELEHETYCAPCFISKVAPALSDYEDTVNRARAVLVFWRSRGDETRVVRSSEKPLSVADCSDEKDTLLKLAFLAAQKKFNALLDVEFKTKKVRNGGYQTTIWSGAGIPARVDASKFPVEERNP